MTGLCGLCCDRRRYQHRAERYHPGGGRGPIGKVAVTMRGPLSATSPNWAPAFAGVELWEGQSL